jgi:hypothetical protein
MGRLGKVVCYKGEVMMWEHEDNHEECHVTSLKTVVMAAMLIANIHHEQLKSYFQNFTDTCTEDFWEEAQASKRKMDHYAKLSFFSLFYRQGN